MKMRKKTKRRLAIIAGGIVVAAGAYFVATRSGKADSEPLPEIEVAAAQKAEAAPAETAKPPQPAPAAAKETKPQTPAAPAPPPTTATQKPEEKSAQQPTSGSASAAIDTSKKSPAVVEKAAAAGAAAAVIVEDVSPEGVQAAWDKAMRLLKANNRSEARRPLTIVYRFGTPEQRIAAREKLDEINAKLIFTPLETEGATIDTVRKGDNLTLIAKRNGVTINSIRRVNGLKSDTVRVGQQLKIVPGMPSIEVDKTNFTLTLYLDGIYVKEYGVGLGKGGKTPVVECEIETMQENPDWYAPNGQIIKFGEPGHEIGTRWMGFKNKPGLVGFGIHGTDKPETIGTESSQGCIRLRNADVEELYDFVRKGTPVRIYEGKPLPRRPDFPPLQPPADKPAQ